MTQKQEKKLISIVVPAYNEAAGIEQFHAALATSLKTLKNYSYEVIFIDDGSRDNTSDILRELARKDNSVRIISLSRNFGKEIATTAGIHSAQGEAIVILDADGQHPVELIADFITRWEKGNHVVIGVRSANQKEGFVKRYGSILFYKLFNSTTGMHLIPGSTDFRLIDRSVQTEFVRMTERNRITRGLIDWLGYQRDYIEFSANARLAGEATYSFRKLFQLAVHSVISLSIAPLYFATYVGAIIVPGSLILGLAMAIESLIGDPLNLNVTGTAYLVILVLFLVGILLVSQGILGLYLSHIHAETQNRPLYVVDHSRSVRS